MIYGTIVVCGGGCYGGYYVRQLARARAAGALTVDEIVVVDQNAECTVARLIDGIARHDTEAIAAYGWRTQRADAVSDRGELEPGYLGLPIRFVAAAWAEFFDSWFASTIVSAGAATSRDAVVPSPLMPHLLADWVAARMEMHRPGSAVARVAGSATPDTPWQRAAPDLAHYASFATWMCPINCIEPARCPETRGPRDWTMPAAVSLAAQRAAGQGTPYDVLALFHTTHRLFGVGMFDVTHAVRVDAEIARLAAQPSLRVLVASVSHCHGALAELWSGGAA